MDFTDNSPAHSDTDPSPTNVFAQISTHPLTDPHMHTQSHALTDAAAQIRVRPAVVTPCVASATYGHIFYIVYIILYILLHFMYFYIEYR